MSDNLTVDSFTAPTGVVAQDSQTALPQSVTVSPSDSTQQYVNIDPKIYERLDRIEAALASAIRRVQWEDKQSESGIQIAGGPTTVTRKGHLVTATILQTSPSQAAIMLLIQEETTNKFYVLAPDQVKPTD